MPVLQLAHKFPDVGHCPGEDLHWDVPMALLRFGFKG